MVNTTLTAQLLGWPSRVVLPVCVSSSLGGWTPRSRGSFVFRCFILFGGIAEMKELTAMIGDGVRRWFAPREIIIRTSGRIQFICLSTRAQLIATTVLGSVVVGAVGASLNLAVEQLHQYSRDIAVRQAESAYNELLTAFGDYVERAGDTIAAADAEVAALAARTDPAAAKLPANPVPDTVLSSLVGRGDAALKNALRERL